jgi:hypothetical protein
VLTSQAGVVVIFTIFSTLLILFCWEFGSTDGSGCARFSCCQTALFDDGKYEAYGRLESTYSVLIENHKWYNLIILHITQFNTNNLIYFLPFIYYATVLFSIKRFNIQFVNLMWLISKKLIRLSCYLSALLFPMTLEPLWLNMCGSENKQGSNVRSAFRHK